MKLIEKQNMAKLVLSQILAFTMLLGSVSTAKAEEKLILNGGVRNLV
jgi:hypothetical protein